MVLGEWLGGNNTGGRVWIVSLESTTIGGSAWESAGEQPRREALAFLAGGRVMNITLFLTAFENFLTDCSEAGIDRSMDDDLADEPEFLWDNGAIMTGGNASKY